MRPLLVIFLLTAAIHLAISCSLPKYIFEPPGSCDDGLLNGLESDEDCGGRDCARCDIGQRCRASTDCENGSCAGEICQAEHCTNEKTDEGETDVNCGGEQCPKCLPSQRCGSNSDCNSNACVDKLCIQTGCDNKMLGDQETDVDCGGGTCRGCKLGENCNGSGDCLSGICIDRQCSTPECGNDTKDPGEEELDCGGTCPKACDPAAACRDERENNNETDIDCGGVDCGACDIDKHCRMDRDCKSAYCNTDKKCGADPCPDQIKPCMEPDGGVGGTGGGGVPTVPEGGDGSGGTSNGGTAATGGANSGGTTPTAGSGGSHAGGGPSGGAPSGGTAGRGGGGAGMAGSGGTGDPPPLTKCPGCARLEAPLDSSDDKANFVINLSNTVFLGNSQITFRVYREAGTGGELKGYIQHGGSPDFNQLFQRDAVALSTIKGWTEFTWNVATQEAPNFDKNVARIGFQITAAGATAWAKPTIVYVDAITVTNANAGPWNFADPGTILTGSTMCPTVSSSRNVLWCNGGDSPVSGTRITWLGE